MGEILEEGDKDDEQKKEGGDGQEGTEKITTEKKEAGNEDVAAAIKDVSAYVNNSDHITCINQLPHLSGRRVPGIPRGFHCGQPAPR